LWMKYYMGEDRGPPLDLSCRRVFLDSRSLIKKEIRPSEVQKIYYYQMQYDERR
jgi:hypothetical protein